MEVIKYEQTPGLRKLAVWLSWKALKQDCATELSVMMETVSVLPSAVVTSHL